MELAEEACVVYICLRPVGSSGEPPRSQLAAEMEETRPSNDHYTQLIAAILYVAIDFFEKAPQTSTRNEILKAWNEHQKSAQSGFYSSVQSMLRNLVGKPNPM